MKEKKSKKTHEGTCSMMMIPRKIVGQQFNTNIKFSIQTNHVRYIFNDDDDDKNSRPTIQYGGGSHLKQSNHILMVEKNQII